MDEDLDLDDDIGSWDEPEEEVRAAPAGPLDIRRKIEDMLERKRFREEFGDDLY